MSRSATARSRDAARTCLPPCSKRLISHCGKRIRCCRAGVEMSWKRCVDMCVGGSPGAVHDDDDDEARDGDGDGDGDDDNDDSTDGCGHEDDDDGSYVDGVDEQDGCVDCDGDDDDDEDDDMIMVVAMMMRMHVIMKLRMMVL